MSEIIAQIAQVARSTGERRLFKGVADATR